MRVRAFRNLNTGCISLQAVGGKFSGKVIAHVHNAHLIRCKMVVHESARQKVIAQGQKNVHAWIEGDLLAADLITLRYPVEQFPARDSDMKAPLVKQTKKSRETAASKPTPTAPSLAPELHAIFAKQHDRHVRYNPYLRGEFFTAGDQCAVWSCATAVVKTDGVWAHAVSADVKADWQPYLDRNQSLLTKGAAQMPALKSETPVARCELSFA